MSDPKKSSDRFTSVNYSEHLEQIKNQTKITKTETARLIEELTALTQKYDPLDLLAKLATYQLFGDPEFERESKFPRSESQVEYLQSLILAKPYPNLPEWPNPSVVGEVLEVVEKVIWKATQFHGFSIAGANKDDADQWLRAKMMIQALHLRGDSYSKHTIETFNSIASQHDRFLQKQCGFDSGQFLDAIASAERSINSAMSSHVNTTFGLREALVDEFFGSLPKGTNRLQLFQKLQDCEEAAKFREENRERFEQWEFNFNRLGDPSLFKITPKTSIEAKIYDLLNLKFGENADFCFKMPKWHGWPLNPSAIYSRPIIKHGDFYYLFNVPLLERRSLQILEEIIKNHDEDYWKESFLDTRDKFVERNSIDLFSRLLPGSKCFRGLHYNCTDENLDKRPELDGLVIYDDTLFIIEAKAGKFTDEARRGGVEALKTDIEKIVDKAYRQARRASDFIKSSKEVVFTEENGKEALRISVANFSRIILVTVSLEKLSSISTGLSALRKLGFLKGDDWPWAIAVNDLRIIAEVSEHPTIFIHFLIQRLKCNNWDQLNAIDELDFFAQYLRADLYFEDYKNFKEMDTVSLASQTQDIDDYYAYTQGLIAEVQKPRIKMGAKFEELLSALEAKRPPGFVSACIALLDYDDESRSKLGVEFELIEAAFLQGRNRFITAVNEVTKQGIVFGGCRVGTPEENLALSYCRSGLEKKGLTSGIAILWNAPLTSKRIKVFYI